MGRAFTDEEKLALRQDLLELGKKALLEKPLKAIKMEDIAKSAGIGKGTVYRFFESKEKLLVAAIQEIEEGIQSELLRILIDEHSPKRRLLFVLQEMVRVGRTSGLIQKMLEPDVVQMMHEHSEAEDKAKMFDVDEAFLMAVVQDMSLLKVSVPIAVDMLRSVFFSLVFQNEYRSDFYDYYIACIVDGIVRDC